MIIYWPRHTLIPRALQVSAIGVTVSGAAALSGFRQAVASPAGAWRIAFKAVPVMTRADELIRRGIEAQAEGRTNPIVIPVRDPEIFLPVGNGVDLPNTPHSDAATFSDGTIYDSGRMSHLTPSGAARGAMAMTAEAAVGAALDAGQYFSVGVRLYRVRTASAPVAGVQSITFWPPAREAIAPDAELVTDGMQIKVRLAADDGLSVVAERGRFSHLDVSFVEDPT